MPDPNGRDAGRGDSQAEDARELIEKVATAIVGRGMAAPAIFLLESSKPLSFLGSQALHFLEPFVRSLFNTVTYMRFAKALEDRENVERLLVRIEALEEESQERAREERRRRKATKERPGGPADGARS